ncbi:MAG: DUF1802 family protein [Deltaproteobacteria bacterium]|nr:DUF1802 family protein [Deltaproteobacteria bacterium]
MIQTQPDLKKALKEWASVVAALESGKQVILLRKGGIMDPGFDVESPMFLLYPTRYHQSEDQIRPQFQSILGQARALQPAEGKIRISSLAQVVDSKETTDIETLKALSEKTIYTPQSLLDRYQNFRPKESIKILFVRTFLLGKPQICEERKSYLGCRSWVDLEDSIEIGSPRPVLSEDEFQKARAEIRSILK